jgi:peptide deformylase
MAVLSILHHPDPRLRKKAQPVTQFTSALQKTIDDMLETMYAAHGIGLAATQVNIQKQIIVIDVSEQRNQPLVLINPNILSTNGSQEHEEGCLSVPDYYDKVTRPDQVQISALNREGEAFKLEADALLAFCIQHEMDHLQGKLFVDYLSPMKQQRVRKKMDKWEKEQKKPNTNPARVVAE